MNNKIYYIIFFGIILGLTRIIPHPPNFTPILASAIMGPILLKDRWAGMAIPILAMFIGDLIIGFHPYQFVVFFTLITISFVAPMRKNYLYLTMMAIGGSVWFFVTTNFAVWVIWDYYPKTLEGLILCFTLAIPFFINTLISTCLFTGLLTISLKYLETVYEKVDYWIVNINSKYKKIN